MCKTNRGISYLKKKHCNKTMQNNTKQKNNAKQKTKQNIEPNKKLWEQ